MSKSPIVFLLGLDSACWEVIDCLGENMLPTLYSLIDRGVAGILETCHPPSTFPAWKCITSGLNPGKIGVYGFFDVNTRTRRIRLNSSKSFKGHDIWDYLGKHGLTSGVMNVPGTYPPKHIKGFIVSGHPAIDGSNYTYPESIKAQIERLGYRIHPKKDVRTHPEEAVEEIVSMIEVRFEALRELQESYQCDFLMLTIFYLDNVQHYLWDAEAGEGSSLVNKVYMKVDTELSKMLRFLGRGTNVFVVSDHGMTRIRGTFQLNTWLSDQGYLKVERTKPLKGEILRRIGIGRIYELAKSLSIDRILLKFIPPETVRKWAESAQKDLTPIEVVERMDWERSKAFSANGNIYLLDKTIEEELIEKLLALTHPKTGEKIFIDVRRRDEVYRGHDILAPDLIPIPRKGYNVHCRLSRSTPWAEENSWKATHTRDGILIASGANIRKIIGKINASIYDITPTILKLYSIEPEEIDGRILPILK